MNKMRWLRNSTKPVILPAVASATVVEIGDLVTKVPAAVAVAADAATFAGVSMQQSRDGDVLPIRCATTGDFLHPCTPDTFANGDLVAIAGPQLLVKTADEALAVGVVVKDYPTATSSVEWAVRSKVYAGT